VVVDGGTSEEFQTPRFGQRQRDERKDGGGMRSWINTVRPGWSDILLTGNSLVENVVLKRRAMFVVGSRSVGAAWVDSKRVVRKPGL
jgi:hypothetical protein